MLRSFTFHSLVPELKNESGHHLPYHTKVEEAVVALGGQFSAYINYKSRLNLPTMWLKWFRRKRDPKYKLRYLFRLFVDYRRIFLKETGVQRVFFLESFTTGDLIPFVVASLCSAKKTDRLWVLFRFERGRKEMAFQALWMRFAKWILKERWLGLCDSELLQAKLAKGFRQEIKLLPHYLAEIPYKKKEEKSKIVCAWLGGPRVEKGLLKIQKLAQIHDPMSRKFVLTVPTDVIQLPPLNNLEIKQLAENLPRSQYEEEFAASDVILLPYEPSSYQYRTSGIFIESVLAGKIPVVTPQTWAAYQLKKYNLSELILDWDNPLFFSHLLQVIQDKELTKKLATFQTAYRELHSLNSFKAHLLDLIKE